MKELKEFSEQLQSLIKQNDDLKFELELYKKQLLIILVNNDGLLKNLYYEDISDVDLSQICFMVGYNRCGATYKGTHLSDWVLVPRTPKQIRQYPLTEKDCIKKD